MDEIIESAKTLQSLYEAKAEEAWNNYQDSGIKRYLNAFHRYETQATICRWAIEHGEQMKKVG